MTEDRYVTSAFPADAIAYHDQLARGWTQRYASGGFRRRADFVAASVLPRLAPSGDWLDVGCGSGVFARMLAAAGARVTAIDGSAAMIEAARRTPNADAIRYERRSVEKLDAMAETFDGIVCFSVIEYLENPVAALAAMRDRLRTGGRLALSAPNRRSTLRRAQRILRGIAAAAGSNAFPYLETSRHLWSHAELAALLDAHGFDCEAGLGFDPVAPRPLWPLASPSLWFMIARRR